jgi:two-component sensor histidine kinase
LNNDTAEILRSERDSARSELAQSERRLEELHHRIANNLQLVVAFLMQQSNRSPDERVRDALGVAMRRISTVGHLYRHLRDAASGETIDFGNFLYRLAADISASTGLHCTVDADSILLDGRTTADLAIIVNELAVNAKKHAYDGEDGSVSFHLARAADNRFSLTVADGGPGLPDGFDLKRPTGLGLKYALSVIERLDGELSAESGDGTRFTITLPLAAQA